MSALPRTLAVLSTVALVPLVGWNLVPSAFPNHAHDGLAAVPLAGVGLACLLQPALRRAPPTELVKACVLAAAFFAWAGNQMWPTHPQALLMNDVAVALFVFDVLLGLPTATAAGPEASPTRIRAE
jgi:hypothetical protein